MKNMKCAEEIMIPLEKYPHVLYWASLREVIAVMQNSDFEINGRVTQPRVALVFNKEYHLLGIARRRDILRGLEPKLLQAKSLKYRKKIFDIDVDPNLSEMSYDKLLSEIKKQAETPVGEVMVPIKMTVNHDDHIIKIIYDLTVSNVSVVPVMKDDKVVGVVRTMECLDEMGKIVL